MEAESTATEVNGDGDAPPFKRADSNPRMGKDELNVFGASTAEGTGARVGTSRDALSSDDEALTSLLPPEDSPLTAYEECAPRICSHDFMSALMNTDPRAAFDFVHFGALFTMESMDNRLEEWSSREVGPDWDIPPVSLQHSPFSLTGGGGRQGVSSTDDKSVCLEVDEIHPEIYTRAPLDKEEKIVDEMMARSGQSEKIRDVLGPDLLVVLRRNRQRNNVVFRHNTQSRKRARDDVQEVAWLGDGTA